MKKNCMTEDDAFTWEKGFDRNYILKKIRECRKISNDSCSFVGPDYFYWKPVLLSAISMNHATSAAKNRCITVALNDTSISLTKPEEFLARCNDENRQRVEKRGTKYIVYFTVTYEGPKLLNWIGDDDTKLYWQPSEESDLLKKCKREKATLSRLLKDNNVPDDVENLTDILVHVFAHDFFEAQEKAQNTVSKLLGMINLLANSGRGIPSFSSIMKPYPINQFRLGPYHTLHNDNGELATEMFWYQPNWPRNGQRATFKGDPEEIRMTIRKLWRKCQSNPLKKLLGDSLSRYSEALDLSNSDEVLLGLWTALEQITQTQNTGYDETVSRVQNLMGETVKARQVAQHIRLRRNSLVHASKSIESDQAIVIMHQVEWLMRNMLYFLLDHGKQFKSLDDYVSFLKLRGKTEVLLRQAELIDYFIALRKE